MDGDPALLDSVVYGVTLSDKGFINYSRIPASLILQNAHGDPLLSIQEYGYPALDDTGDRLFIFYTDTTGMKELTLDGEELWRVQFPSLITCFSHSSLFRLIGLANGRLLLFSEKGERLFEATPSDSRIPIVLGCALNRTGDGIAAVAGLDPQTLVYIQAKGGQYAEDFTLPLASSFRREIFTRFGREGNRLFLEQPDSLGIVDIQSRDMVQVPLAGRLVGFAEIPEWSAVAIIAESTHRVLDVYTYAGKHLLRETLDCSASSLLATDTGFVLGMCTGLMRIDIRED